MSFHYLKLIAALGVRVIRVPDLARASILLPHHQIALVDTEIGPAEWEELLDAVLKVVSRSG